MFQPDTNIVLHYARNDRLAARIEAEFQLLTSPQRPLISVVIEAEIRTLAAAFGWGADKRRDLEALLGFFDIVPIPFGDIVEDYVQVSEFSRRQGRAMGKNDLWIAATAMATDSTLLTTDRDFDHLDPALITRH